MGMPRRSRHQGTARMLHGKHSAESASRSMAGERERDQLPSPWAHTVAVGETVILSDTSSSYLWKS